MRSSSLRHHTCHSGRRGRDGDVQNAMTRRILHKSLTGNDLGEIVLPVSALGPVWRQDGSHDGAKGSSREGTGRGRTGAGGRSAGPRGPFAGKRTCSLVSFRERNAFPHGNGAGAGTWCRWGVNRLRARTCGAGPAGTDLVIYRGGSAGCLRAHRAGPPSAPRPGGSTGRGRVPVSPGRAAGTRRHPPPARLRTPAAAARSPILPGGRPRAVHDPSVPLPGLSVTLLQTTLPRIR